MSYSAWISKKPFLEITDSFAIVSKDEVVEWPLPISYGVELMFVEDRRGGEPLGMLWRPIALNVQEPYYRTRERCASLRPLGHLVDY